MLLLSGAPQARLFFQSVAYHDGPEHQGAQERCRGHRSTESAPVALAPPPGAGPYRLGVGGDRCPGQVALHVGGQFEGAGVAILGRPRHGPKTDRFQGARHAGLELARGRGHRVQGQLDDLVEGAARAGGVSGENMVQGGPQQIHVRPLVGVDSAAVGHLGRHVKRRTHDGAGLRFRRIAGVG